MPRKKANVVNMTVVVRQKAPKLPRNNNSNLMINTKPLATSRKVYNPSRDAMDLNVICLDKYNLA